MRIDDIKKELSSDEKVLESAFKIETLYKKHKIKLWVIITALLVVFAGSRIMQTIKTSRLNAANQALMTLKEKPDDAQAHTLLKENNPTLYELYLYTQAAKKQNPKELDTLSKSTNQIIADISRYHAETLKQHGSDSKLYRDMALLESAYESIKSGKMKEAKEKLDQIDQRSSAAVVSQLLKHYTIKGK